MNRIPEHKRQGDSYFLSSRVSYKGLVKGEIVGFDYQSGISQEERQYILNVIKWLAGMVNKSYYYYDGCEKVRFLGKP
jgi:hypothetical protein